MTKLFIIAACAAALAAGCASQTKAEAPVVAYTVLKADATIPFASLIRDFSVGSEKSLLLKAGGRWYRATLEQPCRSDLPWRESIGLLPGSVDRLDRFSSVLVDGHRCMLRSLDEIADPRPKPAVAATPS